MDKEVRRFIENLDFENLKNDERQQLEEYLLNDEEAFDLYMELIRVDSLLGWLHHNTEKVKTKRAKKKRAKKTRSIRPFLILSALAAAAAFSFFIFTGRGQFATVSSNSPSLPESFNFGDTLTLQKGEMASLSIKDGSRMDFFGPGRLSVKDSKSGPIFRLKGGTFSGSVVRQKAQKKWLIETGYSQVKVIGTSLRIIDEDKQTKIQLAEGKLQITESGNGKETLLNEGTEMLINENGSMTKKYREAPWVLWDFENIKDGKVLDVQGNINAEIVGKLERSKGPWGFYGDFNAKDTILNINKKDMKSPWSVSFYVKNKSYGSSAFLFDSELYSLKLEEWKGIKSIGITNRIKGRDKIENFGLNAVTELDKWMHVAVTCDGKQTEVWMNGVLADSKSKIIPLPLTNFNDKRYPIKALIDEVKIWDRAIHVDEINKIYRKLGK